MKFFLKKNSICNVIVRVNVVLVEFRETLMGSFT